MKYTVKISGSGEGMNEALDFTEKTAAELGLTRAAVWKCIGQLSAVECARLAGAKADTMLLRRSKKVLALPLLKNLNSYERDRVIDSYINGHEEDVCADGVWQKYFTAQPEPFTREEKRAYLNSMDNVAFATNASFSHSEIIERVRRSGVQYIVQPGGTSRDEEVVEYCDKHDLFMIMNSAIPQEDE